MLTALQATKAHFEFGINTKGGAIYGLFLESPQASAKTIWGGGTKEPNKNDLPQLRAFSDIIWGFWVRNNPNIKNIRYFFMIAISNEVTNQIIASCLRDRNTELSEWPGTDFSTSTDQGHALLGKSRSTPMTYIETNPNQDLQTVLGSHTFSCSTNYNLAKRPSSRSLSSGRKQTTTSALSTHLCVSTWSMARSHHLTMLIWKGLIA